MNELTLQLDVTCGIHLYEQIYAYIKNEIKRGKLLQGEKLPSTRALADHLQVSRSTVDLAYEQLSSEGYVEAKPCSGYYICKIDNLYDLPEETACKKKTNNPQKTIYKIDFAMNGIDMESFPIATWKRVYKNVLSNQTDELFHLGSAKGELSLRRTICRYLYSSRGVNCSPDQVIIGAGNDYLLILLEKILGQNRIIAMEDPSYKRAYLAFESCHYKICTIPMDSNGIRADLLRDSDASIAYVMPSHQYPMGVVMPIGRRMELLHWAMEEKDRYIIEDDYDSEFRYKGKPIPSLQASDKNGKVIYIGTFSKSIAPAIRVSYMVLPKMLMNSYERHASFFASTVSRTDQAVLNEFIKEGFYERHLNKMRKRYKTKHDLLLNELRSLEDKFWISGDNAGLHILLHAKDQTSEKDLVRMAKEQHVRVYGLTETFIRRKQPEAKAIILLGYGALSEREIVNGVDILRRTWGNIPDLVE